MTMQHMADGFSFMFIHSDWFEDLKGDGKEALPEGVPLIVGRAQYETMAEVMGLRRDPRPRLTWIGWDMASEPDRSATALAFPRPWLLPDGRPPGEERQRPTLYACLPRAICGTFLAKRTITEGRTP